MTKDVLSYEEAGGGYVNEYLQYVADELKDEPGIITGFVEGAFFLCLKGRCVFRFLDGSVLAGWTSERDPEAWAPAHAPEWELSFNEALVFLEGLVEVPALTGMFRRTPMIAYGIADKVNAAFASYLED